MPERRRWESADLHGCDAARGRRTGLEIGFGIGIGTGFGVGLGFGPRPRPRRSYSASGKGPVTTPASWIPSAPRGPAAG